MCDCERASRRSEKKHPGLQPQQQRHVFHGANQTTGREGWVRYSDRMGGGEGIRWRWGREDGRSKTKPNEQNAGVDLNGTKLHKGERWER